MHTGSEKILMRALLASGFVLMSLVIVGGITRLTHSGLSIVEWKPLTGLLPPLNDHQWLSVFNDYKAFPEYKILNKGMSLSEFKFIFFWEYIHRMLGRLLGMMLIISFVYAWAKKSTPKWLTRRFFGLSCLVGLQGALGWYMVKSGLSKSPYVSHLRLTSHLCLAFFTLQCIWWTYLDVAFLRKKIHRPKSKALWFNTAIICFVSLTCLQVIYGALTAGLKAGFMFNTFPKMADAWFPTALLFQDPISLAMINQAPTVQFIHRLLAWLLLFTFAWLLYLYKQQPQANSLQKKGLISISCSLLVQFTLGVCTLIYHVPTSIAVLHQFGALLLLSCTVFLLYVTFAQQKTPSTAS